MPYSFDADLGQYRDSAGRLVPEAAIRRMLDEVLAGSAGTMRNLTQSLIDGGMPLATWQASMMAEIKAAHLVASTLATGGWQQMDQSDFGFVGQRIRSQYAYLRGFAQDIAAGRQRLDGTAQGRATMYADAARQTHRAAVQRVARQRGEMEERNALGLADHCSGCLAATAEGWVPLGTLVPCGERQCLTRCHCHIVYRVMVPAPAMAA